MEEAIFRLVKGLEGFTVASSQESIESMSFILKSFTNNSGNAFLLTWHPFLDGLLNFDLKPMQHVRMQQCFLNIDKWKSSLLIFLFVYFTMYAYF